MARTSDAHLARPLLDQSGDPLRLFQVGANWTRTSWQKDPDTGLWLPGVLLEPARTNRCRNSHVLTGWTPANCSVASTSVVCPDGVSRTANSIQEDSASSWKRLLLSAYHAATPGQTLVWGYLAKKPTGGRDYLLVRLYEDTGPTQHIALFNLANGVVGSATQNIIDRYIEPWGDGWYLCVLRCTAAGGAGSLFVEPANADATNGSTYAGDSREATYVFGMQYEDNVPYRSSLIETSGSAATRTADGKVVYVNDYLTDEVTVVFPVWIPEHAPASDQGVIHLRNSAGSSYLSIGVKASTGVLRLQMKPVGGTNTVLDHTTNICDGKLHWIGASARCQEYMVAWVDGVGVGAVPLDQFKGAECDEAWLVGNNTVGPWTGGIHIWPKFMTRMPRPVQPQLLTP